MLLQCPRAALCKVLASPVQAVPRAGPARPWELCVRAILPWNVRLTTVDGLQDRLVHRLDRDASGALVVALTADAAAWLSAAFRSRSAQQPRSSRTSLGQIGEIFFIAAR